MSDIKLFKIDNQEAFEIKASSSHLEKAKLHCKAAYWER